MASGRELWGELQSGGQVVALEGDVHDAAEFACWVRGQIPHRYALIFWDQGYTSDVPLTESTVVRSTRTTIRPRQLASTA